MTERIKRLAALTVTGILLVCAAFAFPAAGMTEETGISEEIIVNETPETAETAEETVEAAPETAAAEETVVEAAPEAEAPAEVREAPAEETVEAAEPAPEPETEEPAPAAEPESKAETAEPAPEPAAEEQAVAEAEHTGEAAETEAAVKPEAEEPENTPETEEIEETETEDDEYVIFEDDDPGYVDPELVEIMFPDGGAPVFIEDDDFGSVEPGLVEALLPNGGAPVEEPADDAEQAETETDEKDSEPVEIQLRIALDDGQTVRVGEPTVLTAQPESEITGVVTWEILDETKEEETWDIIGLGKRLTIDVTEETLDRQIRFVLEDGSVSEIFTVTETEEPAQETEEPAAEARNEEETAETAEETAEQTEVRNEEENTENTDNIEAEAAEGEAAAEETAEEPAEETGRAWITAETDGENGSVILTAEADVELDDGIVWQAKAGEDGEWKNIWYGKTWALEITEESAGSVLRFRTSEGLFSEEFRLTAEEESEEAEAEEAGEEETEEIADEENLDEEIAEEEAPELPENRSVDFTITGDGEGLRLGDVAHFNAELTGYEELEYTLQWQMSADNENWEDIPGANEAQMDLVLTEENARLYWRVTVLIHMPQAEEIQNADEILDAEEIQDADEILNEEGPEA